MEHTPGPWESLDDIVRVNDFGSEFHHIEVCRLPDYLPGRKANARLIAASPEMEKILWDITEALITKNVALLMETTPKAERLLLSLKVEGL
jgi:hypothetical protein